MAKEAPDDSERKELVSTAVQVLRKGLVVYRPVLSI